MRGANAYQLLREAQEPRDAEPELHGRRYEVLRETQQELDFARQEIPQGTLRLIETLEQRCAALERELDDLRGSDRSAGPDEKTDLDRALALSPDNDRELDSPRRPGPEDPVAPEEWTERGGMAQQQASALEWVKHGDEVRRERLAEQGSNPEPGVQATNELSQEDKEMLAAARASEAQARDQDRGPGQLHEPSGP